VQPNGFAAAPPLLELLAVPLELLPVAPVLPPLEPLLVAAVLPEPLPVVPPVLPPKLELPPVLPVPLVVAEAPPDPLDVPGLLVDPVVPLDDAVAPPSVFSGGLALSGPCPHATATEVSVPSAKSKDRIEALGAQVTSAFCGSSRNDGPFTGDEKLNGGRNLPVHHATSTFTSGCLGG
jgi:hypothetical protein